MSTPKIIISLTIINSRLHFLPSIINNILNQTLQPDIIHIWYSATPLFYDTGIQLEEIEFTLTSLLNSKIDITEVKNIGSYRKLIPVLQKYRKEDAIIITIDDDHTFENNFIQKFIETYIKHKSIVCSVGKLINFDNINENKDNLNYILNNSAPILNILPEGYGGILYHTSMFDDSFIDYDYSSLPEPVLKNDDLFFRWYTYSKEIRVVNVNIIKNDLFLLHNFSENEEKLESLYFNYNSKINYKNILNKILNLNIFKNNEKLKNINLESELQSLNELETLKELFKNKICSGADIKLLQYEYNALNRCSDKIDIVDSISTNLFKSKYHTIANFHSKYHAIANFQLDTNVLLINLEFDKKRYHSAVDELAKLSISNFVHLKATYWKDRNQFVNDLNFVLQFLRQFNNNISDRQLTLNEFSEFSDENIKIQDGPLACYVSHLRAWIYSYLNFEDYTIICEDDMLVANTKKIKEYIARVPLDWDIITLNAGAIKEKYDSEVYKFTNQFHSTHFYIIRNSKLSFIFKHMYPIFDQVDILLSNLHSELNIYNLVDTVYQKNFSTNTQNNIYIIYRSPNYESVRGYIKELKEGLLEYINSDLIENEKYNSDIIIDIIFDVVYNYIANKNITQNSTQIILTDTTNTTFDKIKHNLFLLIHFCVKGENHVDALLNDIFNIIHSFKLHCALEHSTKPYSICEVFDGVLKSYKYGSSSNVYIINDKEDLILKVYNDNLRWKTEYHSDVSQLFNREVEALQRLMIFDNGFPFIHSYTSSTKEIKMTYVGESLYSNFNLPEDWQTQIKILFENMESVGIEYTEFNLKNIVVKEGIISFVDFGLCKLHSPGSIFTNNSSLFIELLELLKTKMESETDSEMRRIVYFTFMNNMRTNEKYSSVVY